MARRLPAVLMCVLVSAVVFFPWSGRALAQDGATPSANDVQRLFQADGVNAPVVASGTIDPAQVSQPHFLLERLEVPSGASMPQLTAGSLDLLAVQTGSLSIEDNY